MKPVDQEFMHDPDNGVYGDCHRAVLASLLSLPRDQVPHFFVTSNLGDPSLFWDQTQDFLSHHGMAMFSVPAKAGALFYHDEFEVEVYHAISGPSPRQLRDSKGREVMHTVVARNGKIVHDPHPSRAGLAGSYDVWTFDYLVATGAGKPMRVPPSRLRKWADTVETLSSEVALNLPADHDTPTFQSLSSVVDELTTLHSQIKARTEKP